nr:hypothetical protein CTI12_AA501740 [Tanacetum cinerariifolium]
MSGDMNVPKQVLDVLPCDPFEQIDIARKITSIALSTRVSSLESESSILQQHIAARDDVIVDLESKLHSFDFSLSQDLHNLSIADHQKENLLKENAWLLETINKLKRDVAKLETFRKTLMMSLQDEEGILSRGPPEYRKASRPRISQSLLFASQTSSPWLTPPETPPTLSASASPTRTPPPEVDFFEFLKVELGNGLAISFWEDRLFEGQVISKILSWWNVDYMEVNSYEEWSNWLISLRLTTKHKEVLEGVFYALWWSMWSFRNKVLFDVKKPSQAVIFDSIVSSSFYWCNFRSKASFSWTEWLKNPYLIMT